MANFNYKHENEAVKPYIGRTVDVMPVMKAEGKVPVSVAWYMMRRLLTLDEGEFPQAGQAKDVAASYWNNHADCVADGVICHPDGRAKIVLDSQDLRELTPQSKLVNYGLVLDDADIYEAARGVHIVELTQDEVAKYTGKHLPQNKVKDNKLWRILARHPDEVPANIARDKNLLPEYATATFSLAKQVYNHDENMGLFLVDPINVFTLWLWCVNGLNCGSYAYGNDLDDDNGRALGVAPEALELTVAPSAARISGDNIAVQESPKEEVPAIIQPSLEQILAVALKYSAGINHGLLRTEMEALYRNE